MSALSRQKGRRWELEVSRLLAPVFPLARPNLAQSRGTRVDGPDILGVPLWIECYHGKANAIAVKWRQAQRDAAASASVPKLAPVVIAKRDRQEAVVLMWAHTLGVTHVPLDEPVPVMIDLASWLRLLAHRRGA